MPIENFVKNESDFSDGEFSPYINKKMKTDGSAGSHWSALYMGNDIMAP